MTQHIRPQHVATVSFGTLLLCLTGSGSALAASGAAVDGALTGQVGVSLSAGMSILPSPTPTLNTSIVPSPTPVPTDLSPVTSTVQSLTGSTSSPAPAPSAGSLPGGTSGAGGATGGSAGGTRLAGSRLRTARVPGRLSGAGRRSSGGTATLAGAVPPLGSLAAGAARAAELNTFAGQVPTLAPQSAQLMAAGRAPALASTPRAAFGGWGGQDPNVPRGLLVALATMVVGGLAAGHVKMAQRRLVQLGSAPPRYQPAHRAES